MKIIKILITGLVVLLVLIIAAIAIFATTFDANQYKQNLSELVKQQTGRTLDFQGDIGLTIYPQLGMKLGSMSFENAAGFGNQPMLAVNSASVSVDVMSLISFQPQIEQLNLDGLSVRLVKNKQGVTNWDDLVQPADEAKDDTSSVDSTTNTVETDSKQQDLEIIGSFGGLNITRVNLNWTDESTSSSYQVDVQSLTTGVIEPGKDFPLKLNMNIKSGQQLDAAVTLQSLVSVDSKQVNLSGVKLMTRAAGTMIPVDSAQLELSSDIQFLIASNQLSLKGFNSSIATLGGVLKQTDVNLSGEIGFDLNAQLLTIAVLDIRSVLQDPSIPKERIEVGVSSTQLEVQLTQRAISLEALTLALNENQFNGYLKVKDYDKPSLSFDLSAEKLDVDKLLGKSKQDKPVQEDSNSEADEPAKDIQIQLPMALLRGLELDGKLAIGTLIAEGLSVQNVLVKLDADQGIVNVNPVSLDLYDGSFAGSIQVNVQKEKPAYTVVKKLSSFQVGKFLKDFSGDDMVSGAANIDVSLTTKGEWLSQLKSQLNGNLKILVEDGALKGFNFRHKLDTAKAKLKREKVPELVEKKTDFSALSISGVIKDGIFNSEDLDMKAPLMRVSGKGSADLSKETVDYLVNAKLVTTSKGQLSGGADDLGGLPVPVGITGSWYAPKIDVQYDELIKAQLDEKKAKVRAELENQKAALKAQLAEQKEKLKQTQQKEMAAKKAQLEEKKNLAEAKQKAELEAKKKAEKERAEQKLKDKLKKLF